MPSSHVLVVGISGYDKLRVFTHHQPIVDVVKNSVRQNLSIQDVDPENTAGIALVGNGEGCGQEQMDKFLNVFCLDEISFRQDYNSCRIGVVVVVVVVDVVPHLWKLCDFVTFVMLELHFWNLIQCLLLSFCMGSEILVKIGLP